MKKINILLCFFLLTLPCTAQPFFSHYPRKTIDSLHTEIAKGGLSYSQTAKHYEQIAECFSCCEMDSVLFYAKRGIDFMENDAAKMRKNPSLQLHRTLTKLYGLMNIAYCFRSEFDSALLCCIKMDEIARQFNDKRIEGENFFGYGYIYSRQGKYVTALDYYFKHLEFIEKNGAERLDIFVRDYGNIGDINRRLHNYEQAIFWFQKAIIFAKENNDGKSGLSLENFRVKGCYLQLGATYYEIGDTDRALEYILQTNCTTITDVENSYGLTTLARIYVQKKDFQQALKYAKKALEIAELYNDRNLLVNAHTAFSEIYMTMGDYNRAAVNARLAWQADTANIDENRAVTYCLARAHLRLGNTAQADYFLQQNADFNRRYSERTMRTIISDMEINYQTEEKNRQITAMEKQRTLYFGIGAVVIIVFLLAFALIYYRHRLNIQKRKNMEQKLENAQQEQQIVAAQATLDGESAERLRLARDLHDGLGGILSAVRLNLDNLEHLDNARSLLNSAIDELRRISHNLMPAALKYGIVPALEDFCASFSNVKFHYYGENAGQNTPLPLPEKTNLLLYRCAHELVNNAIKHARATEINVELQQMTEDVSLTVQDNGGGFDINTVKRGAGLDNLRNRVSALGGKFNIVSADKNGTEINIELKLLNS